MKYIFNILISIIFSLIVVVGAFNVPAHYFNLDKGVKLGTLALTDIASTDKLSAYPTVQNANNTLIENVVNSIIGTTTNTTITSLANLVTVGTITSGTWTANPIGVGYGGTGTTSPTSKQIMFGNGSSGFQVIGFGTNGQFLTSSGDGSLPTWTTSALDLTANYNWTGTHYFKNLNASSTVANPIYLNTLSYNTPSTRAASSTVLMEDGSGNLTWNNPDWQLLVSTTTQSAMGTTTMTIPARNNIKILFFGASGAAGLYYLTFNSDTAANYGYHTLIGGTDTGYANQKSASVGNSGGGNFSNIEIDVMNYSTLAKSFFAKQTQYSGANILEMYSANGVWNNTSNQITSVQIGTPSNIPSGSIIRIYGSGN